MDAVVNKQSDDNSTHQAAVANMMACFDTLNDETFRCFILTLKSESPGDGTNVNTFVQEVLAAFHGLISNTVYDERWNCLIMLMNSMYSLTSSSGREESGPSSLRA